MRNNPEINWKDQIAVEAMKEIIAKYHYFDAMNENESDLLAARAYSIAEAMFREREKDKHNPTPSGS